MSTPWYRWSQLSKDEVNTLYTRLHLWCFSPFFLSSENSRVYLEVFLLCLKVRNCHKCCLCCSVCPLKGFFSSTMASVQSHMPAAPRASVALMQKWVFCSYSTYLRSVLGHGTRVPTCIATPHHSDWNDCFTAWGWRRYLVGFCHLSLTWTCGCIIWIFRDFHSDGLRCSAVILVSMRYPHSFTLHQTNTSLPLAVCRDVVATPRQHNSECRATVNQLISFSFSLRLPFHYSS